MVLYLGHWRNTVNLTQQKILDDFVGVIDNATDLRKGNFGEIATDIDFVTKGYESLHTRLIRIDGGHQGIDGVYRKDGRYYIVESKYGNAELAPANPNTGLDRQMSDAWIAADNRLADAVRSTTLANEILNSNYIRILASVKSDGSITYKLIGTDGYLSTGGGIWTPTP